MPPRLLIALLIGGSLAAPAGPAAASAKATWEGVALLPSFSELGEVELARYDLAARTWLEPVRDPLLASAYPLQLEADASGIYARQTNRVIRIPHDGVGSSILWEGDPARIGLAGPWLFVLQGNVVRSLEKVGGAIVAERALPAGTYAFVVADAEHRLVFPGERDLLGVDYFEDGSLGPVVRPEAVGPRHSIPSLTLFPDGERVLEPRYGGVYDTRTLTYLGGVPLEGEDAAFGGGRLFVSDLRGNRNQIVAFSSDSLSEIGRVASRDSISTTLIAHGSNLFVFSAMESGEMGVVIHDAFAFALPQAGTTIDPAAHDFKIQQVEVTRDEVAILLPAAHTISPGGLAGPQLFRWSVVDRSYLPSLPLREPASHILYEARSDALYVIYESRRITLIENPGGEDPQEVEFAVAPFEAASAAWIRDRLLIGAQGWDGIFALSSGGLPIRVFDAPFELRCDALAASEASGRIYLKSYPDVIASFLLDPAGRPEQALRGPGDVPSNALVIRASPDGAHVFEGAAVRDGRTLETVAPLLGRGYAEAFAWDQDRLVIADHDGGGLRLRAWAPPFSGVDWELVIPGIIPGLLVPSGDGLLLVYYTSINTYPYWAPHLAQIFPGDDLDGDGVPNESDAYLLDPTERADRDGDGVGDNADAFPDDRDQHADRDGDRIADPLDNYPDDPELATALIGLQVRIGVPPFGFLEGSLYGRVHLFEDGNFLLCPSPDACIPGTFQRKRNGRLKLQLAQEILDAFEAVLEEDLEGALSDLRGHPVDLALHFRADSIRLEASVSRRGKRLSIKLAFPYEARTNDLGRGRLRGTFRIRGSAETMAR